MAKSHSIKNKIYTFVFIITLTCTFGYTVYHYRSEKAVILRAIDNKLIASAYAVPHILAEDFHVRAVDAESIPSDERKKNLKLLTDYVYDVGVKYIYSIIQSDNQYVFTSSSATTDELDSGDYVKYFEVYLMPSEGLISAFDNHTIIFEEEVDEFGYFRSVLIPLKTSNGITYVVGADIPMEFVQSSLRLLLIKSTAIGIIFFIIFFVISVMVGNRIANPIVKLTDSTFEVIQKGFDFSTISTDPLEEIARASNDEIGKLAKTYMYMQRELQQYIINLTETTAAKERIESELKIAHDIQMGLLPKAFPGAPSIPELNMHALLEPAKQVGGDLYDSFVIDDEHIFFGIGDVSDKGVPAALFMAVTKALFRAYGQEDMPLNEIVQTVNNELSRENTTQMFVTMFCCIIDIKTGTIEYCDGGHENPFILYRNQTVEMVEKKGGMALGFMPDTPYESETIRLEPGDTFFLYTDGVNEAMNTAHEQFSVPYLQECLEEKCQSTPDVITKHIMEKVHEHAGTEPQSDDITVFAVRFNGNGAER